MVSEIVDYLEIYRENPGRRRECLYYLALGEFKLCNYKVEISSPRKAENFAICFWRLNRQTNKDCCLGYKLSHL